MLSTGVSKHLPRGEEESWVEPGWREACLWGHSSCGLLGASGQLKLSAQRLLRCPAVSPVLQEVVQCSQEGPGGRDVLSCSQEGRARRQAQEVSVEPHCIQLLPVERPLCSRHCSRLGAVSWVRWQGHCSRGALFQSRGGL